MATGTSTTRIFQERLEGLILESGKDIKELAQEIGISTGALSKYQNDAAEAGINALKKIADYFKVSCDWLLGGSKTKTAKNEAINKRLGLNDEAIQNLEHCYGAKAPPLRRELFNLIPAVNELIGSEHFSIFIWSFRMALAKAEQVNCDGDFDLPIGIDFEDDVDIEELAREKYGPNTQIVAGGNGDNMCLYSAEKAFHDLLYSHPFIREFKRREKELMKYEPNEDN